MLKKWMIAIAFIALGCGDDGDDPSSDAAGNNGHKDASTLTDAGSQDSAKASQRDSSTPRATPDGSTPQATEDAGDDMMSVPDSSSAAVPDGGTFVHGSGSCCEAHPTPGCANADLEVCVCEKDPSCCTTAWGPQCTIIVAQKFCQPTVRDCVCTQWEQAMCCDSSWSSSICDSVASIKCGAVAGCF